MSSTDAQLAGYVAGLRSMGTEKAVVDEVLKTALNCMLGEGGGDNDKDSKVKDQHELSSNTSKSPKGMELMLLEVIREFFVYMGYDVSAEALRIESGLQVGIDSESLNNLKKMTGVQSSVLPAMHSLLMKTEIDDVSEGEDETEGETK